MPENGTSGLMSGERKRSVAAWPKLPRLSSTLRAHPGLYGVVVVKRNDCQGMYCSWSLSWSAMRSQWLFRSDGRPLRQTQPPSRLAAGHRRRRRVAALTAARLARGFLIGTFRCAS